MATIETIPALRRYIRSAQTEGLSLRTALKAHRQSGGKVRTDDFSVLWRDEQRKTEREDG